MGDLSVLDLGLSHFRSHRSARLRLDGRPVAIWGPNGAGKTNLLEALSLLSPGRGLRRASPDEIARRPEGVGWKVTATLKSLWQVHEIETWAGPGEGRQLRIDGKTATQVSLGHVARVLWLVPAMDRLWLEAAEGRRRFLDRMAMSFEPMHAEQVLIFEKAMRERNRLLREQVHDGGWYAALESQMAESGSAITATRERVLTRLAEAQGAADTGFPQADLALADPEGEPVRKAADLAAAWADGRRRDMAAGRTLSGPHRADLSARYAAKGMPADQCSTGEQKALLISLILANAHALAEDFGAPPILLLDEVAAHLDASRRAVLYAAICAMGAQAFLTGTGIELFQELGERAQAFELSETNGDSEVVEARLG